MLTTKNAGIQAFTPLLCLLGLVLLLAGCQPPGAKALLGGEELIEEGDYERALARLNKAAELLPANAQVHNHRGIALHHLRRYEEAAQAYHQALKLDRNLAAAHYNLGNLYLEQNLLPQAITELTIFTTVREENPNGWLRLGTALLRARNPDEAGQALSRALRLAPKNPEIYNNLALAHLQHKRPREALRALNTALELDPDFPAALLNQAIVIDYYFGNKKAAIERYQAYLQTKPAPAHTPEIQTIIADLRAQLRPKPPVQQPIEPAEPEPEEPLVAEEDEAPPAAVPTNQIAAAETAQPVEPGEPNVETEPQEASQATNQIAAASPTPSEPQPSEPEPEAEPEPEPEPEPVMASIPLEVVEIKPDPVFRPAPPPAGSPAQASEPPSTNAPAAPEPRETQMARAASSQPEVPIILPRRQAEDAGEDPGFFERLNPARLFRRDREPEQEPEPRPAPRVVPERPRPPIQQNTPLPDNLPRYEYTENMRVRPGSRSEAERFFARGVEAHKEKRYLAAIEMYKNAVEADPSYYEAAYNLGLAAYQAGQLPLALGANERAVRLDPSSINARYNFALALLEANYPLDAANELRELIVEAPSEVRAHFALANIYAQRLNQPFLAQRHYQRVLELEPDHPDAARIRRWLANPG